MFEDGFSDNEDEWYFDSIKRYKQLNMFELQNVPLHVEFSDAESISVVSEYDETHSEITQLILPTKSLITTEDALCNDSDLKLKCGTFTESVVTQAQVFYKKDKIFCSEKGIAGVSTYSRNSQSDRIIKSDQLKCELVNPQIALNQSNDGQLILSKDSQHESFIIDITLGSTCQTINTKDVKCQSSDILSPLFIHNQSVSFLNKRTGKITLWDFRMNSICGTTGSCQSLNYAVSWTYCTDFYPQYTKSITSDGLSSKLFLLSCDGDLITYDSRNLSLCCDKYNTGLKVENGSDVKNLQVNCCPNDRNVISVSGYNSSVYVYKLQNTLEQLFIHDGHSHVENCEKDTVVSSHAWIFSDDDNKNQIISGALNKTLQLWQF